MRLGFSWFFKEHEFMTCKSGNIILERVSVAASNTWIAPKHFSKKILHSCRPRRPRLDSCPIFYVSPLEIRVCQFHACYGPFMDKTTSIAPLICFGCMPASLTYWQWGKQTPRILAKRIRTDSDLTGGTGMDTPDLINVWSYRQGWLEPAKFKSRWR